MSDQLLAKIEDSLRNRPEVKAAWLAGSRGRGTNDAYSDIDIWVAIDDAAIAEVVADPLVYVHAIIPTLMHIVAPEIAPKGGAFVGSWVAEGEDFDQIDWYIAPFSTAIRGEDTMAVFGEVPVEIEQSPVSLTPDVLQASIYDNLVLALQMINNMVKHGRRDDAWRALGHARHADGCIVNAQWLVTHGTAPDYSAMKRSVLPDITVLNAGSFQLLAYLLLDHIEQTAEDAGVTPRLADAIAAMRHHTTRWQSEQYCTTDTGLQLMSVEEFYASLPRRRVGSGLLITNSADEILLLETTYKDEWEITGGHADEGESPRVTAAREAIEEIGLPITPGELLVIDHVAKSMPKGDMLAFVYDGGVIDDPSVIEIDHYEIRAAHFVPLEQVHLHTTPDMTKRLHAAMRARKEGRLIEVGSDLPDGYA